MCGFAGLIDLTGRHDATALRDHAERMGRTLNHRGPDDGGVWVDDAPGVALAHRRLSILDLSPAGHQPMMSSCGRYVICFNGEIYNHLALRRELERQGVAAGHLECFPGSRSSVCDVTSGTALDGQECAEARRWRGHSDTETLLECVSRLGLEATLSRCVGMFAFALWDRQKKELTLARDRMGEKPLYYGWQQHVFVFGSELKALRAHPEVRTDVDRDALVLFLRHNYVPDPYTIYRGISKLPPGTYLAVSREDRSARPVHYWSMRDVAERAQSMRFSGSPSDAMAELDVLLRQSIKDQMLADVPLGAFLSGGIDSSLVVALMQAQSSRPIKTFTIGFWEKGYSEAEHAKAVAGHLGTEHTELYVTENDAIGVIPRLPEIYDEPFADSSQIPTYLISKLARRDVTVCLSGDGGDELFGGYNRYFWANAFWRRLRVMPPSVRRVAAALITRVPPGGWNAAFRVAERWLPAKWRFATPGDKLHKLAEIFTAGRSEEIYRELISHWKTPTTVVRGAIEPATVVNDSTQWARLVDFQHWMMYLDSVSYLPGDILTKVDRASMSASLETRVPLLDHRVVEFAWRLPLDMKIQAGEGKWILRNLLRTYVPAELVDRPKMGFGVPLDTWLRGPLKEWAVALLDETRLRREGFFEPEPIRAKLKEHLDGSRNWAYYLWDVLMFQAWYEKAG